MDTSTSSIGKFRATVGIIAAVYLLPATGLGGDTIITPPQDNACSSAKPYYDSSTSKCVDDLKNLHGIPSCAVYDAATTHSCAYMKKPVPATLWSDTPVTDPKGPDKTADGILSKLNPDGLDTAISGYKTKLVQVLKDYSKSICANGPVEGRVEKNSNRKTPKTIVTALPNGDSYNDVNGLRNYVRNSIKNNVPALTSIIDMTKVTNSFDDANNWAQAANDNFLNVTYDSTQSKPTLHVYCPTMYKRPTAQDLYNFFGDISNPNISVFETIGHNDWDEQAKKGFVVYSATIKIPPPDYVSSSPVYFKDNDPNFDPAKCNQATPPKCGGDALLAEIAAAVGSNKKIKTAQITVTSSSLNNTRNYCRKDFGTLSANRAETVKGVIKSTYNLNDSDVPILSGSTNGDSGSAGPCAYQCKDGVKSPTCNEVPTTPAIQPAFLDTFQSVHVTLYFTVPNTAASSENPPTLSANRFCYDLTLGCSGSNFKGLPLIH